MGLNKFNSFQIAANDPSNACCFADLEDEIKRKKNPLSSNDCNSLLNEIQN